jgi:hypothetical protein
MQAATTLKTVAEGSMKPRKRISGNYCAKLKPRKEIAMIDFNDAEPQMDFSLIPANTIAKARLALRAANDFSDSFLTRSKNGDSTFLNCEFTILEGPYAKRKIFDKIGISGSDQWINMGKARIRAILESAKNINPKDMSETAMSARKINSFEELNGLEVAIRVGIESDRSGVYQDKNKVASIITPDHLAYKEYTSGQDIPWSM